MREKPLSQTNPYLRDPKKYEDLLIMNVTSSTAIELGKINPEITHALKNKRFPVIISAGGK